MKEEGKVTVWLFVFPPLLLLHFPTAHFAGTANERGVHVKGRGLWVSPTHPQKENKPLGRKWSSNFVIMQKDEKWRRRRSPSDECV